MKIAPSTPILSIAATISSPVTCGGQFGTLCQGRFAVRPRFELAPVGSYAAAAANRNSAEQRPPRLMSEAGWKSECLTGPLPNARRIEMEQGRGANSLICLALWGKCGTMADHAISETYSSCYRGKPSETGAASYLCPGPASGAVPETSLKAIRQYSTSSWVHGADDYPGAAPQPSPMSDFDKRDETISGHRPTVGPKILHRRIEVLNRGPPHIPTVIRLIIWPPAMHRASVVPDDKIAH